MENPNRGCGSRSKGGIYLEVAMSASSGTPWHHFLFDPLWELSPEYLKLAGHSAQGMTYAELNNQSFIFDHVGKKNYPLPADFLEEALHHPRGFSRRYPKTFDFTKINPETIHVFLHDNCPTKNLGLRWKKADPIHGRFPPNICPQADLHNIMDIELSACAGLMWYSSSNGNVGEEDFRHFPLKDPFFSYVNIVQSRMANFSQAAFYWLPIQKLGNWIVVEDPDSDKDTDALEILGKAGIAAEMVEN